MGETPLDDQRMEIRLSGSGGQGIILAAVIIADAAAATGKQVVQTQSYGPEARGGASKAEIVVADGEVDFPEVTRPDVTLCLSQAAFDKYATDSPPGSLIAYDSGLVDAGGTVDRRLIGLPFTQAAVDRFNKAVVANIVAVGALVELLDWLSPEAVAEAVLRRAPERFRDLNAEALQLGRELAARAPRSAAP